MDKNIYYNVPICYSVNLEKFSCVCCLDRSNKFAKLSSCIHTGILDILVDVKMEYEELYVCYICHSTLEKFDSFRKQVQDNLYLLQRKTNPLAKRKHNYGISDTEQFHYNAKSNQTYQKVAMIETFRQPTPVNKLKTVIFGRINDNDFDSLNNANGCLDVKQEADHKDLENVFVYQNITKTRDSPAQMANVAHSSTDKFTVYQHKTKKNGSSVLTTNVTQTSKAKAESNKNISYSIILDHPEVRVREVRLSEGEFLKEREEKRKEKTYALAKFKCESCVRSFQHETFLKEHDKTQHSQALGGFMCKYCKVIYKTMDRLVAHMKHHFLRYHCMGCEKHYTTVALAARHYKERHAQNKETLQCEKCDFTTYKLKSMRFHMYKHEPHEFECEKCKKRHRTKAELRRHNLIVHSAFHAYSCPECDKKFKYLTTLNMHLKSTHKNDMYYCRECDKQLYSQSTFNAHMKTWAHRKEGDLYICHDCGRSFHRKQLLEAHIVFIHLRKSKHVCHICKYMARTSPKLRRHIETVHYKLKLPKTKICHHCGKGFQSSTLLKVHIRTHTGERPLQCALCPATFAHPAARFTHARLVHNVLRKKDLTNTKTRNK